MDRTFSLSTLQNKDILFFELASMAFFALHTMKSGEKPADLSSFTLQERRDGGRDGGRQML